jgi:pimeloyl-ACP methyl ester carboxylesterase
VTPEQIFAVVAALIAGDANPDFNHLRDGSHDDRYPVAIEACKLPPSTLEVEGQTILCGTVTVPENYDNPDGRKIPLEFAILKARSQSPAPDPLIYLHGGPAGGTLASLSLVSDELYANHRRTRDIVTFDQRAAALSAGTVTCYAEMADHLKELAAANKDPTKKPTLDVLIKPCVEEILASGADLPAYNSENNARDVRALMSALGYPTYNIYGISYGTRLALEVLRTAPDGVRSVVVDGVAPTTVYLYDDLYGPYADALDALVDQCAADEDCNAAYPDLHGTINAAFTWLSENGPIPAARGRPEIGPAELFVLATKDRNDRHNTRPVTRYLPRIFAELAEGKSDAYDALMAMRPPDRIKTLTETKGLTEEERTLVRVVLETAEAVRDLEDGARAAIERLKADLAEDEKATSVAEAFDARATTAALQMDDQDAVLALLRDYALLQTVEPGREPLIAWVNDHFSGQDHEDLLTLIAAMTPADIKWTFDNIDSDATKYQNVLRGEINVYFYACQEDIPWNSREGYERRIDELAERYPFFVALRGAQGFYDNCEGIEPQPRPGFQTPVVSDVPVLSLNGLKDTQTSWKWGAVAVETLENGRNYVIPEAGHGSIAYQTCPNDISVAFLNDPTAELDVSCIDKIKVDFVMPDDPLPE